MELFFVSLILSFYQLSILSSVEFVPFDLSMSNHITPGKVTLSLYLPKEKTTYEALRKLYRTNHPSKVNPSTKPRIPKIIHQVWLGSPFPEKYKKYRETWLKHHPDWKYKLWTDSDIKELKLYNQAAYDAATNYGEKSDIVRYEILYRYGGLYIDTDFECLKPFDIFHNRYTFYTGIMRIKPVKMANGLIASIPKHPILRQCIETLHPIKAHPFLDTVNRTGPTHFSQCFLEYIKENPNDIIALPISYFYAIPLKIGCYTNQEQVEEWIRPESYALHYWASSWTYGSGLASNSPTS
ncbi:MAG TPA: glycosyltransferase [Candidatus Babeliaceae bacterium]|nr:glycosyltransferase [Candidatus Babeliaceae bacterium]